MHEIKPYYFTSVIRYKVVKIKNTDRIDGKAQLISK